MVGPERFRFLNEVHDLSDVGWDDRTLPKLWRYNLHYFDDLNAHDADARVDWHRALLPRWVSDNPPGIGTAWESYPTSLRIVNWIKWSLNGNLLAPGNVQSLAVQVRWLSRRIEHHLLGNHLFANAKALVFAGLYFDGPEANVWLETGLRIIAREVPEQVLPDGGHFERSTMYHALALEDVEDLCNIVAVFACAIPSRWKPMVANWSTLIDPMRRWLATMSHPDGEIAYFNDSAVGVAPTPAELERYAVRLGVAPLPTLFQPFTQLTPSGYVRIQREDAVVILDVAPIGPDYLPAHAHADTLSFEMSLFGQRFLVNSGTSEYGTGAERMRQRGTRAHNTVMINGKDSSEVWGGFRVARRARPVTLNVMRDGGPIVQCAHNGYQHLSGKPMHTRTWLFGGCGLIVEDRISGRFEKAEATFHLHPTVRLDAAGLVQRDGSIILVMQLGQKVRVSVEGGVLQLENGTWHPEFGVSEPNLCLTVAFTGAVIRTQLLWGDAV